MVSTDALISPGLALNGALGRVRALGEADVQASRERVEALREALAERSSDELVLGIAGLRTDGHLWPLREGDFQNAHDAAARTHPRRRGRRLAGVGRDGGGERGSV